MTDEDFINELQRFYLNLDFFWEDPIKRYSALEKMNELIGAYLKRRPPTKKK